MRRSFVLVVLLALVVVGSLPAGAFNRKLSIGDEAPAWTGLTTIDGKTTALPDFKGKDLIVVAFLCNHCPVAQAYEQRLIKLTREVGGADGKVAVVAFNVDTGEDEQLAKVKEHAREAGFNFTYAVDPTQKIGRAYGATVTPQFFVLDRERKVAYMGAFDDNLDEAKVKVRHLETAIQALLKGEKLEKAETRPSGCSIEYGAK
jgi:peroxiredoxin